MIKQGVILAAGSGTRMLPLSDFYPKVLLPICNKPLMRYQIDVMKKAGILDITIVIGKLGSQIKNFFGNGRRFGVKISWVVDKNPQGIASSLMRAKSVIYGPFALFLGDIFVYDADIKSAIALMVRTQADGIIIGRVESKKELVARNFSITTNRKGRVLRLIEKPKRPPNLFKGNGLYLFSGKIFEAIAKTGKSNLRNEVEITDSIQTLIDSGGKVYAKRWQNWDFNLSSPRDLLDCNLKMLKEKGFHNLIGKNAKINPGAKIQRSVIGDRAAVIKPIFLDQCLVFADTTVRKLKGAKNTIFAGRTNLVL